METATSVATANVGPRVSIEIFSTAPGADTQSPIGGAKSPYVSREIGVKSTVQSCLAATPCLSTIEAPLASLLRRNFRNAIRSMVRLRHPYCTPRRVRGQSLPYCIPDRRVPSGGQSPPYCMPEVPNWVEDHQGRALWRRAGAVTQSSAYARPTSCAAVSVWGVFPWSTKDIPRLLPDLSSTQAAGLSSSPPTHHLNQ